nr:hypothetical protein [Gammaproteobacteria bacterium]
HSWFEAIWLCFPETISLLFEPDASGETPLSLIASPADREKVKNNLRRFLFDYKNDKAVVLALQKLRRLDLSILNLPDANQSKSTKFVFNDDNFSALLGSWLALSSGAQWQLESLNLAHHETPHFPSVRTNESNRLVQFLLNCPRLEALDLSGNPIGFPDNGWLALYGKPGENIQPLLGLFSRSNFKKIVLKDIRFSPAEYAVLVSALDYADHVIDIELSDHSKIKAAQDRLQARLTLLSEEPFLPAHALEIAHEIKSLSRYAEEEKAPEGIKEFTAALQQLIKKIFDIYRPRNMALVKMLGKKLDAYSMLQWYQYKAERDYRQLSRLSSTDSLSGDEADQVSHWFNIFFQLDNLWRSFVWHPDDISTPPAFIEIDSQVELLKTRYREFFLQYIASPSSAVGDILKTAEKAFSQIFYLEWSSASAALSVKSTALKKLQAYEDITDYVKKVITVIGVAGAVTISASVAGLAVFGGLHGLGMLLSSIGIKELFGPITKFKLINEEMLQAREGAERGLHHEVSEELKPSAEEFFNRLTKKITGREWRNTFTQRMTVFNSFSPTEINSHIEALLKGFFHYYGGVNHEEDFTQFMPNSALHGLMGLDISKLLDAMAKHLIHGLRMGLFYSFEDNLTPQDFMQRALNYLAYFKRKGDPIELSNGRTVDQVLRGVGIQFGLKDNCDSMCLNFKAGSTVDLNEFLYKGFESYFPEQSFSQILAGHHQYYRKAFPWEMPWINRVFKAENNEFQSIPISFTSSEDFESKPMLPDITLRLAFDEAKYASCLTHYQADLGEDKELVTDEFKYLTREERLKKVETLAAENKAGVANHEVRISTLEAARPAEEEKVEGGVENLSPATIATIETIVDKRVAERTAEVREEFEEKLGERDKKIATLTENLAGANGEIDNLRDRVQELEADSQQGAQSAAAIVIPAEVLARPPSLVNNPYALLAAPGGASDEEPVSQIDTQDRTSPH